ncbi:ABC transporter ATP-binding protein [Candidatus Halocynthiibacter alkanivorans]|uniref:ABC transporter ATP-binding protein n=1 Tax=Candidatus Halocynthiibacter alkanivorans TaxID=2267619 RepID=UPI000DF3437C|nr:sn-glycerol-3-phosphate ABC transporter ATP-binding protein UgpC [Candidatus Halocynthiibacter alkanivorans]
MAQVTISSVNKIYPNGFHAVKDADFHIKDGEFIVLVGPSGCGKSTLLRMFAGLEDISTGEIAIDDRVVNDVDPAQRDIAMVFQNYALYPHMTVYKNMAYGLKRAKKSKEDIEIAVQKVAKMLDLTPLLDRKPSQLSGGQRQRVAMGRAIVRSPKLFLFDEPLSNLDAKLRSQMRIEVRRLQRDLGVTSVYVTHDQVEAMTMADRIVVLNAGKIEQIGTPAQIYQSPASVFVATFMGAPPMNMLEGGFKDGTLTLSGGGVIPHHSHGANGPVSIGIRPEKVTLQAEETPGALPFTYEFTEDLGAVKLVHGLLGGERFIVHTHEEAIIGDDAKFLSIDGGSVHVFDVNTGQRID